MNRTDSAGVPKVLYVLIIVILAAMYYYAAYMDVSKPEKIVQDFYDAYFERDFDKVAENLSVFWSVQFLPQYSGKTPAELLNHRDRITQEISSVIADIEKGNELPDNMSIQVHPEYTRTRAHSALVGYSVHQDAQTAGMEMAILIKEAGRYRIYTMTPISAQMLENIPEEDVDQLDESFAALTGASE